VCIFTPVITNPPKAKSQTQTTLTESERHCKFIHSSSNSVSISAFQIFPRFSKMAPISQSARRIGLFAVTLMAVSTSAATATRPWGTIGSIRYVSEETLQPEVRTALATADEAHIWRQVEHAYRYSDGREQDDEDQVIPVNHSSSRNEDEYDAILHQTTTNKNIHIFGRPSTSSVPPQDEDDDEFTLLNSYSSRIGRIA
jgi:hypothetical protein